MENKENKIKKDDNQLDLEVLEKVSGGAGLSGTVKTETKPISQDTTRRI